MSSILLCMCRNFTNFFFSHITLIEGHVKRLRVTFERLLVSRSPGYLQTLIEVSVTVRE